VRRRLIVLDVLMEFDLDISFKRVRVALDKEELGPNS